MSLPKKGPLFFLFCSLYMRESCEVTPLFLGNDGFPVIITLLRVRWFLFVSCSHIRGSVRLASDNELIDDVCL